MFTKEGNSASYLAREETGEHEAYLGGERQPLVLLCFSTPNTALDVQSRLRKSCITRFIRRADAADPDLTPLFETGELWLLVDDTDRSRCLLRRATKHWRTTLFMALSAQPLAGKKYRTVLASPQASPPSGLQGELSRLWKVLDYFGAETSNTTLILTTTFI